MSLTRVLPMMLVAGLIGCDNDPSRVTVQNEGVRPDTVGPVISHTHDPSPRIMREPVFIGADIYDVGQGEDDPNTLDVVENEASGVFDAQVYFQRETDGDTWASLRMDRVADGRYEMEIPSSDVTSGGIRYYLWAIDEEGNESCLPEACESDAWHFPVVSPR